MRRAPSGSVLASAATRSSAERNSSVLAPRVSRAIRVACSTARTSCPSVAGAGRRPAAPRLPPTSSKVRARRVIRRIRSSGHSPGEYRGEIGRRDTRVTRRVSIRGHPAHDPTDGSSGGRVRAEGLHGWAAPGPAPVPAPLRTSSTVSSTSPGLHGWAAPGPAPAPAPAAVPFGPWQGSLRVLILPSSMKPAAPRPTEVKPA